MPFARVGVNRLVNFEAVRSLGPRKTVRTGRAEEPPPTLNGYNQRNLGGRKKVNARVDFPLPLG